MSRVLISALLILLVISVTGCIQDSERKYYDGRVRVNFEIGVNIADALVIIHSYNVTVIDYGTIHAGVGDFVFIIAEVPIGEEEVYISRFESHPKITNAIREGEPPEEE